MDIIIEHKIVNGAQVVNNITRQNGLIFGIKTLDKTYRNIEVTEQSVGHLQVMAELTSGAHAGKVVPFDTTGTDGREIPIGVIVQQLTAIPANAEIKVNIVNHGEIDRNLVKLKAGQTLDTVYGAMTEGDVAISGRTVEANLITNCQSLKITKSLNITKKRY